MIIKVKFHVLPQVLDEIEENGIHIYPLPDCDTDEEEDYKEQVSTLPTSSRNLLSQCSKTMSFIHIFLSHGFVYNHILCV